MVLDREPERWFRLTLEEALGLLDIALMTPMDLTPEQKSAVMKLSEYCRQSLKAREDTEMLPPRQSNAYAA